MTNLQYDAEKRILTGEIEWPKLYFGTKTWEYEIEFDSSFEKIINGSIDQYNNSGELFDCYRLCDPKIPHQDFKLKTDAMETALSRKKKCNLSVSNASNEKLFHQVHETHDSSLAISKINNATKQAKQFGLKLTMWNDQNCINDSVRLRTVRLRLFELNIRTNY